MLENDNEDFLKTKEYMNDLILDALGRFQITQKGRRQLQAQLIDDVRLAAERFLARLKKDGQVPNYKFSAYFTWYISKRIGKLKPKRNASH